MYLGAHVSTARGIENAIKTADKYNINTIQMMITPPMRWATKLVPQEDIEKFVEQLKQSQLKKILLHGIYLTNLARKDKKLFHLSKMGLVIYLDFAERVGELIEKEKIECEILGVCFHPGSQKELSYEDSIERISYGMNWVLNKVPGKQKLLIETTAGMGNNLGRSFAELRLMREGVEDKKRVGFVVDTQHTYVAGYDWVNDMDNVVKDMEQELEISNIRAIHLNDSLTKLSSNKDRHANLGEGEIGSETLKELLHRKEFKETPFILETPALKSSGTMEKEINTMKKLAK
ncbi:deoxyribonuclease IV [bacterium]|nr:deoxyribonuclease IV [bacterium]